MTARQAPKFNDKGQLICGAKNKPAAKHPFCQNVAGMRTNHLGYGKCYRHLGATAQSEKGALMDKAEEMIAEARRAMVDVNADPVTDPLGYLQRMMGQSVSLAASLMEEVNELSSPVVPIGDGGALGLHPTVQALQRQMRDSMDMLNKMVQSGFEDRRVRVTEQMADLFVGALTGIFADLQLTGDQRAMLPTVVPRWMRTLDEKTIPGQIEK